MEDCKDQVVSYKCRLKDKKQMICIAIVCLIFILGIWAWWTISSIYSLEMKIPYVIDENILRSIFFLSLGGFCGTSYFSVIFAQKCKQINYQEMNLVLQQIEFYPELKNMTSIIADKDRWPVYDEYNFIMKYGIEKLWKSQANKA